MMTPADEALVTAAQSGQMSANHLLYERFQPFVRCLLRKYRHLSFSEDLPGEIYLVFAALVRQYDRERGIPFPHYISRMLPATMHTVVRRERLAHSRELSGSAGLSEYGSQMGDVPWPCRWTGEVASSGGAYARMVVKQRLGDLLVDLTPRQAYVFVNRALRERQYDQIAAELDSSPGAVRFIYHSARKRLKRRWLELSRDEAS